MPMYDAIPVLETPRLRLRGHEAGDFEASATMWADAAVVRHISGKPSSLEESWSRFLGYAGHWQVLGFGYWVVQDRHSGDFLGEAGFADFRRAIEPALDGRPEAGWVLKAAAHGQGIATEAVRCMTAWADAALPRHPTVCIVAPGHDASIRVARKAGFSDAGTATYRGVPTLILERPKGDGTPAR